MENNKPTVNAVPVLLEDLVNIAGLIDAAISRGAYRGPELEHVGKTYNKLTAAINSAQENEK